LETVQTAQGTAEMVLREPGGVFTDRSSDEKSQTLLKRFKAEVDRVFGGARHGLHGRDMI